MRPCGRSASIHQNTRGFRRAISAIPLMHAQRHERRLHQLLHRVVQGQGLVFRSFGIATQRVFSTVTSMR
jgi:hypothetical protein